ncbi:MAG TPA: MBL fold metallo-hydrolase, partial [Gaiellaceae bacterium]|nr:MBL fold metallo-hydrolase [Gaiellaceae bacterium]
MSLELLVLGSGSPYAHPRRASSAYLVRAGDRRLLVDAGGGTLLRLGEQRVDPGVLDAVLLTHTHIDHSGGLPAVVFAAVMGGGARPLRLLGPAGRGIHPGVERFAGLLFGEHGAWSYLRTFDGFGVAARELPSDPDDPALTSVEEGISSVAVGHGMMPSVAYRLGHGGGSVAIGGDPESYQPQLVELARGCDVLVHDFALPERETEHGHLHADPSDAGRVAAEAGVGLLVLTHVFPEHEDELDASLA